MSPKALSTALQALRTLCLLTALSLNLTSGEFYSNNVYIDPHSTAAEDSETCLTSNSSQLPCKTFNYAFQYRNHSTRYILASNSSHKLTKNVSVFENLQKLAIVGEGGRASVTCDGDGVGLGFINVLDISFTDVEFLHCSAIRNSTSKNFFRTNFTLYTFSVGLYFYSCADVSMTRVDVSSSPTATGVVMYDTVGRNVIQDSVFANNTVPTGTPGGGGFYVEFSYCVPGDDRCNDADSKISVHGAVYTFVGCNFTGNTASNEGSDDNSTYIVPYHSNHQAFGRGGGLSIFIKGSASGNHFEITNCSFLENRAQWGGGLFVELHDETANNYILVTGCVFERSRCSYTLDKGTGGGGLRIGHYVYDYFNRNDQPGNRIEIAYSNFSANSAMYGGGVSISPTRQNTENVNSTAVIKLTGLIFWNNTGKIGAALHIGLFQLITSGMKRSIAITDCSFVNNMAHFANLINMTNYPHTIGIGAVYINQMPVEFRGQTVFYLNSGTALAVVGAPVDFTQAYAVFANNEGYRGGAIALLGSTYMLVQNNTTLEFSNNTAADKGGAIYIKYAEMDNLMTQSNCFVRHRDPFLTPNNWNASFLFFNNTDRNGYHNNSIHTSSVLPCAWAGGSGNIVNKKQIFCWSGWEYRNSHFKPVNDCATQITSEPGKIELTSDHEKRAIPGKPFQLPLNVTDDFGSNLVKEVVFSSTSNRTGMENEYFWGGNATVSGQENTYVQLQLTSLGERIWHITMDTMLLPCPPGLSPTVKAKNDSKSAESVCVCSNLYQGALWCDPDTRKVKMKEGNWIGKVVGSDDKYLLGSCPPSFCKVTDQPLISLPISGEDLSTVICGENREGVVCGKCVNGTGPAVNSLSYECVNCTDINLASNVAKYVASVYLPLAALFTVLILFDIRLTTGPANAFILYCQVVSSTLNLDADGHIPFKSHHINYEALQKSYKVIYGVFNLEFVENLLSPFCLNSNFSTLTIFALDYGVALFPLAMIMVVVICLKVRECLTCCANVAPCQADCQCSSKRSVNEALLPAFAAFLLLSYTKFSLTASYITGIQYLVDEDGTQTGPPVIYYAGQFNATSSHYAVTYQLPSVIVFAFVCITPLLLLAYPLAALEWCLSKVRCLWRFYPVDRVHIFLDTFQGCYRNRMRFFAGLYFVFRLVVNVSYMIAKTWLQQFIITQMACMIMAILVAICRPYKREKDFFNYVDTLIFANLALINSLTFYLYTTSLSGEPFPLSAFVIQYILVFLPLFYMLGYVVWYTVTRCHVPLKNKLLQRFKAHAYKQMEAEGINSEPRTTRPKAPGGFTRSEVAVEDNSQTGDSENDQLDALFDRAHDTNRYRRARGNKGNTATDLEVYGLQAPGESGDSGGGQGRTTNLSSVLTSSHGQAASNGYGSMSSTCTGPSSSASGSTGQQRVTTNSD